MAATDSSSSSFYSFRLISRACVTPAEYVLKSYYISLSVVAIACVTVVLARIAVKRWRQKPTTSIGRLVEFLVVVQGLCAWVSIDPGYTWIG